MYVPLAGSSRGASLRGLADGYIVLPDASARARNMLSASFTHLDSGGHGLPNRLPAQSNGRPSHDAA